MDNTKDNGHTRLRERSIGSLCAFLPAIILTAVLAYTGAVSGVGLALPFMAALIANGLAPIIHALKLSGRRLDQISKLTIITALVLMLALFFARP